MKVIALSEFKPRADGSVDQNGLVSDAGKVLDDLHRRGILQTVYLRRDKPGTVILFECGTPEDAHGYMRALPGVQAGTTTYELVVLGSEIPPGAFLGARVASH